MLSVKQNIAGLVFVILLFLFSGQIKAQVPELVNGYYDTTYYLPAFYKDALNYNLMIASSKGYLSEIRRLAAKGADVNGESEKRVTPIFFAVYNNQLNAAKILISLKADVNSSTTDSETPLLAACKYDYEEIAESLIRAGANVDYDDRFGATPIHYASVYGYLALVDMLIYYDANPDRTTYDGTTPLMAAIWAGNEDVADLLIQNGAKTDIADNEGDTPFLMATINGDTLIMNLLIKTGADIYAVNNSGHNALTLSIMLGNTAVSEYLLKKGDKWTTSKAIDPYKVATKYSRKEVLPVLRKSNVPGNIKPAIDQIAITISEKIATRDIYTGINLTLKEPYLNAGFTFGLDTKLYDTRVMLKQSDNFYYQYWEKSTLIYGGIFKEIKLTDNSFRGNSSISASLCAGYSFTHYLKGTSMVPPDRFKLIPALTFKKNWNQLSVNVGFEYCKSEYYKVGPVWLRAGLSFTTFFENIRIDAKTLKWY
jgi:ankyrin repeat protein